MQTIFFQYYPKSLGNVEKMPLQDVETILEKTAWREALAMYTMFTIPFYGALKSLFGEYKFKTLHIRKSLFFGFILIFLHKIASLSCISTKKHYFDLFSYSKNHFVCLLSIVLKRSLYYCFSIIQQTLTISDFLQQFRHF